MQQSKADIWLPTKDRNSDTSEADEGELLSRCNLEGGWETEQSTLKAPQIQPFSLPADYVRTVLALKVCFTAPNGAPLIAADRSETPFT